MAALDQGEGRSGGSLGGLPSLAGAATEKQHDVALGGGLQRKCQVVLRRRRAAGGKGPDAGQEGVGERLLGSLDFG